MHSSKIAGMLSSFEFLASIFAASAVMLLPPKGYLPSVVTLTPPLNNISPLVHIALSAVEAQLASPPSIVKFPSEYRAG